MPTSKKNFKFQISNFKLIILLFFLLLVVNCQLLVVSAQETPLDKAQEDYTFQFTKYREAQDEYVTARSSYLTFKTAVAKSEAFLATRNYLDQIDSFYLAYIFLVNEHANSLDWTSTTLSRDFVSKIASGQTSYFQNHQEKVSKSSTLEELTVLAADLKNHVDGDLTRKINKTLAILEIVEAESALSDFDKLTNILDKAMISKNQQKVNQSFYDNWTSEISDIRTKFETFKDQAKAQLAKTKEDTATKNELDSISNSTKQAKSELQRSKPLFEEVIKIL